MVGKGVIFRIKVNFLFKKILVQYSKHCIFQLTTFAIMGQNIATTVGCPYLKNIETIVGKTFRKYFKYKGFIFVRVTFI